VTGWWRLRLTTREVASALRRFGRPADIDAAYLDQGAELVASARRPSPGPARVLDFVDARQRLRP
jgi:hypothetical protein